MLVFEIIILSALLLFMLLMGITGVVGLFLRVPFVPSSTGAVKLIDELEFHGKETLCDLGCGNGKVLFYIRKKYPHMKLIGYEIAPIPFLYAWIKDKIFRTHIDFRYQNFFHHSLEHIDVFFCYLMPEVLEEVYEKIKKMKQKIFITNTFSLKNETPEKIVYHPKTKKPILLLYKT